MYKVFFNILPIDILFILPMHAQQYSMKIHMLSIQEQQKDMFVGHTGINN